MLSCTLSTKKTLTKAIFPKTGQAAFSKPIPTRKGHHKLSGYHILTTQNLVGELTECTVARKLARYIEMQTATLFHMYFGKTLFYSITDFTTVFTLLWVCVSLDQGETD